MAQLEGLLSSVKDAETGHRGYLLTADQRYLEPYMRSSVEIENRLQNLDRIAGDLAITKPELEEIKQLTRRRKESLDYSVRWIQTKARASTRTPTGLERGKQMMDALQAKVNRALEIQASRTQARVSGSTRLTWFRTTVFACSLSLSAGTIWWALSRMRRQAESALAQRNLTEVTLRSIGDGVIITDETGRITFLNAAASEITGWKNEEAKGLPACQVFQIVDAATKQMVESPVELVLKRRAIVDLSPHTLLIQKSGKLIAISNSGAPIRDSAGNIHGVVLVFRDFTAHEEVQRNLLAAKEEAEIANIAKGNFLALLSHELRTPLTPVVATLTAWEQSGDLTPELLHDVSVMRRCVDLESRLIDDLLDITRIATGKLYLDKSFVNLHELVRNTVELCTKEMQAKKLHVELMLNAVADVILCDPARIQQVLWNLLRNSIKFTPEQGLITISSRNAESNIILEVTDTGIGMQAEQLEKVFQPFEQGSSETVRRYGGLGLGMAISKALVESHAGDLRASSDGPAKGSTFILTLPVAAEKRKTNRAPKLSEDLATVYPGKKRILLVEDHADTAYVISKLLESHGHQVDIASSTKAAVDLLTRMSYSIVISDIGLPDGSGFALISHVRNVLKLQMPAIALTGFGTEDDVKKNLSAGFNAHLTKPVNFLRLESMINRLCSGSESEASLI